MDLLPELLGILGTGLLLYGYTRLGNRCITGWVFQGVGDLLWIAAGILMASPAVWFSQILFTLVHLRGWLRWHAT